MGRSRTWGGVVATSILVFGCGGSSATGPDPEGSTSLTARHGHAMTYDRTRHLVLLFGGWGTEGSLPAGDRSSLWAWDGSSWERLASDGPTARHEAALAWDEGRSRAVLYGGLSGAFPNETVLSDTWEWDGTTWTRKATTGPTQRVHQGMAYDPARGRTVLYGGFSLDGATELHDVWEWDGSSWTRVSGGPSDVLARGAAHDEKAGAFYLIGYDASAGHVVLDRWDGTALTRTGAAGPGCEPALRAVAGLGATRGGILSAGSCNQVHPFESWRWDGAAWSRVAGVQPPERGNHAMAYDAERDRVVLFGGESLSGGADFGDTWEFDGTSWSKR